MGALGTYYRNSKVRVNRALQFIVDAGTGLGRTALLTRPGAATAITGAAWTVEARLRLDAANGGGYVLARANGSTDEYALIYNFVANTLEFFSSGAGANNSGGTVRLALNTATPPGPAFHTVQFVYDNATLRAFLNGQPAGNLPIAGLLLGAAPDLKLALGVRNDTAGGPVNATIDYLKITTGAASPVVLALDEASPGPYFNQGTAGGQLDLATPAPVSVTL